MALIACMNCGTKKENPLVFGNHEEEGICDKCREEIIKKQTKAIIKMFCLNCARISFDSKIRDCCIFCGGPIHVMRQKQKTLIEVFEETGLLKKHCGNCVHSYCGVCDNCDGVEGTTEVSEKYCCKNYEPESLLNDEKAMR